MKKKRKTVLRDWSFLIFLFIFGCVYIALFGFPMFDGGKHPQELFRFPLFAERETGDGAEQPAQEAEETVEPENAEAPGPDDAAQIPEEPEPAVAEEAPEEEDAAPSETDADTTEAPEENAAEEPEVVPEETEREIAYQTVEDDYFADAVFIGDSRTMGMYEYGGLEGISTFGCSKGLTIYKMFDSPIVEVPGQIKKQTVEELLSQRQFSSIYLMIGINEMGAGTVESFIETYGTCVEHLRELQPQAAIYLQSIMRVTEERSAKGDYITNEGIDARNDGIAQMADGEGIFYLDVNPVVCDESGGMIKDYTTDGVHLKAKYIALWKDYLKCHVVRRDEIG